MCVCVCVGRVGQASMTSEERAAAIAKMPVADRAAALVCMHGSSLSRCVCVYGCSGGMLGCNVKLSWSPSHTVCLCVRCGRN